MICGFSLFSGVYWLDLIIPKCYVLTRFCLVGLDVSPSTIAFFHIKIDTAGPT